MTAVTNAPPLDPELAAALAVLGGPPLTITPPLIPMIRDALVTRVDDLIAERPIVYEDRNVPGPAGGPDLTVTIFQRSDRRPGGPGVFYIHPGGMIIGDRFFGIGTVLDWVDRLDVVAASVEYRLAPEHQDPVPLDDCFAGLVWMASQSTPLGFDPDRLVIAGASAGGGLAAGTTLRARDAHAPVVAAQLLIYPMLDDRNESVSSHQFDGAARWNRGSNQTGWTAYLGDRRGTDQVSIYAAPARATDLSGLPPTFLDVGSAEVFRDEVVAYASQLWADGGDCELHVWPGGFHAFDLEAPTAILSLAMIETRIRWLERVLAR
jgi:acetyl esterase/lipase